MRVPGLCATPVGDSETSDDMAPLRVLRPAPVRLPPLAEITSPMLAATPDQSKGSSLAVMVRIPSRKVECSSEPRAINVIPLETEGSPEGPCQKRKRAGDTRKHETMELLEELQHLEEQLKRLKKDTEQLHKQPERPLERATREAGLQLARVRCMFSQYASLEMSAPVHTYLHLEKAMESRRRSILEIKPKQLHLGREFMDECSKHLNPTSPFVSNEWHISSCGDAYGIHFYVDQLRGCHNVPRAFEAAVAYVSSYEISVKKTVSIVTYHDENIARTGGSNSQIRLVMTTASGVVVEANTLIFARYDPKENIGVAVATYVDEDDLRPYDSTKRVRQEVTGVLTVSPSPVGVVLRHWVYTRTKKAPHLIDPYEFSQFARENEGHKAEDIFNFIRQHV